MRITNDMRAQIRHAAVSAVFGKQFTALKKEAITVLTAAYKEQFAVELAEVAKLDGTVRDEIATVSNCYLYVQVGDNKLSILERISRSDIKSVRLETTKQFELNCGYRFGFLREGARYSGGTWHLEPEKCPTTYPKVVEFFKRADELKNSIDALHSQLTSLLVSATSDKKLLTLAPELDKYVPKGEVAQARGVIPMDVINSVRAALQGVPKP